VCIHSKYTVEYDSQVTYFLQRRQELTLELQWTNRHVSDIDDKLMTTILLSIKSEERQNKPANTDQGTLKTAQTEK